MESKSPSHSDAQLLGSLQVHSRRSSIDSVASKASKSGNRLSRLLSTNRRKSRSNSISREFQVAKSGTPTPETVVHQVDLGLDDENLITLDDDDGDLDLK